MSAKKRKRLEGYIVRSLAWASAASRWMLR